jgi:hypothetical protein
MQEDAEIEVTVGVLAGAEAGVVVGTGTGMQRLLEALLLHAMEMIGSGGDMRGKVATALRAAPAEERS